MATESHIIDDKFFAMITMNFLNTVVGWDRIFLSRFSERDRVGAGSSLRFDAVTLGPGMYGPRR